jgi:iron(III) transport system ATP-binding protein
MRSATSEPTLKVRGLNKYYMTARGPYHAARGVSFDVEDGEFYTLLGPSGCGKSTTLRCVAGLEHIDDGEISIAGKKVNSSVPRVYVPPNRRDIGMVFQNYGIWPHMNVFDNVAFPITVSRCRLSRKEVVRRTEEALSAVQLSHLSGRHATELSGGQQQRVDWHARWWRAPTPSSGRAAFQPRCQPAGVRAVGAAQSPEERRDHDPLRHP